jgi:voltage-gated potassium channel
MVARVPLFAKLDAEQVAEIMHVLRSKSVERDEVIVRRGEAADAMYFIAAGEVEIELPREPVRLRTGDFFGEIAILARSRRTATVKALERTKLLVLEAGDLKHLLDHHPDMAAHIRAVAEARVGAERIAEPRHGSDGALP